MPPGFKAGGRQKGTPNKVRADIVAAAVAEGKTPLQYMLDVMRDETADENRRDDMAKSAAPYIHQKPQAGGSGLTMNVTPGTGAANMGIEVRFVAPPRRNEDE